MSNDLFRRYDIGVVVENPRPGSASRRLARAIVLQAPACLSLRLIELDALPNDDVTLNSTRSAAFEDFARSVDGSDGLVFLVEQPESLPDVLRNAINLCGDRTERSIWTDKPVMISGTSASSALIIPGEKLPLRRLLLTREARLLGGDVYIRLDSDLFDQRGAIADQSTRMFLSAYIDRFVRLLGKYDTDPERRLRLSGETRASEWDQQRSGPSRPFVH